jgi:hypothetical protein
LKAVIGGLTIGRALAKATTAALALATATGATAATPATSLFYERAVMTAADGACRLFAPDVGAALLAAKSQARGAALRSGADAASLAGAEARAIAAVGAAGCASPDIAAAAARVRSAFQGYAQLDHMDFPGELASWTATRPPSDGVARWRVEQRDRFGWDELLFGIVGRGAGRPLMAVASFADGAAPASARLVMRDPMLTSGPYLDSRQADVDGRIPIDSRLPPRGATRVFAAEAISSAGTDLRSPDMKSGWAFRFPADAATALAGLDPREAVAVEFVFPGDDGESVRTAYVEVGDFAAANAFQALSSR